MTQYVILSLPNDKGQVKIRRLVDGLVTSCKLDWLKKEVGSDTIYVARSKTKDIRMSGLNWERQVG